MRRILLGFVFLLTGCCLPQSRTTFSAEPEVVTTKIEPADEADSTVDVVQSMLGFTEANIKTPDPIPASILPEPDSYQINTRVIIEGQPVQIPQNEQMIEGMWWARTPEDVRRDLDNAEKIYEKIGIKFHITEVSFKEMNPNLLEHFIRANMHPDQMTVVYMLPNSFSWDGYSSAPWEMVNRGIVVHYLADEWTVAHEIGHYFGLLHTFNEDFADDTSEQTMRYCTGKERSTPNCHNIMNYCDHEPKHITSDQLNRFKRFLRAKRMNHYVRDYTDVMLRGHEFPTPSGTNIVFNVTITPSKTSADSLKSLTCYNLSVE